MCCGLSIKNHDIPGASSLRRECGVWGNISRASLAAHEIKKHSLLKAIAQAHGTAQSVVLGVGALMRSAGIIQFVLPVEGEFRPDGKHEVVQGKPVQVDPHLASDQCHVSVGIQRVVVGQAVGLGRGGEGEAEIHAVAAIFVRGKPQGLEHLPELLLRDMHGKAEGGLAEEVRVERVERQGLGDNAEHPAFVDIKGEFSAQTRSDGAGKVGFERGGKLRMKPVIPALPKRSHVLCGINAEYMGSLWKRWYYWLHAELSTAFESDFPGAIGAGLSGELAFDVYEGWMLGIVAKTLALNPLNADLFGEATFSFAVHVSQKQFRQMLQALGLASNKNGSDRVNFSFAFTTSSKTYRLSDDNPLYSNGYMALVRSKVGVYLDWLALDNLMLSIGPEFTFNRQYKLYNSGGTHQSSHTQDNALGGSMGLRYSFQQAVFFYFMRSKARAADIPPNAALPAKRRSPRDVVIFY
eukprot:TRINITY_DN7152_c0_g1_i2.p2 TRINITY_DN7152_c0_g1~~TRINITY_DN7152_c0_g1_i2.p2  ORF type:complete len:466 (-),score=104.71 TRINITY_DN7152_c0_g1_i2:578-1975(-)